MPSFTDKITKFLSLLLPEAEHEEWENLNYNNQNLVDWIIAAQNSGSRLVSGSYNEGTGKLENIKVKFVVDGAEEIVSFADTAVVISITRQVWSANRTTGLITAVNVQNYAEMAVTEDDFPILHTGHYQISSTTTQAFFKEIGPRQALTVKESIWRQGIINPMGEIHQRGDFNLVKDSYGFAADRLAGMATGTAVSAGIFTAVNNTSLLGSCGYAFKFEGVTLTGAGILYARYRMEAKDARKWKTQYASFGFKVYHDAGAAINYTIYVRKADAEDDFSVVTDISNSGAISVESGIETKVEYHNVALGDVSNGLEIELKIETGAIATKNFYLSNLQMNQGGMLLPFQPRFDTEELKLCQPYFQKSNPIDEGIGNDADGQFGFSANNLSNNTHTVEATVFLSVPMRTKSYTITTTDLIGNSGRVTAIVAHNLVPTFSRIGQKSFTVTATDVGASPSIGLFFSYHLADEL